MFDKLDAYNLVANLIPGAALVYALSYSGFPSPQPDNIVGFLLVAFVVGVTTNRLGSLVLDNALRRTVKFPWADKPWRILHEKNYKAFVTSEKNDPKLETIVANSGLYRTFFTCGLVYAFLMTLSWASAWLKIDESWSIAAVIVLGMVVFFFAFRKEDNYIHERLSSDE